MNSPIASNSPTPAGAPYRRRIHYVDKRIQKWLLVALVTLEIVLVGGAVWLMHGRLSQLIESTLYRVHLANTGPMMDQLMREAIPLLIIFVVANLVALIAVDTIWYRYVRTVLRNFMLLIGKTNRLDFSQDPEIARRHEVLARAAVYRERERARLTEIRARIAQLDHEASAGNDAQRLRNALNELQELVR